MVVSYLTSQVTMKFLFQITCHASHKLLFISQFREKLDNSFSPDKVRSGYKLSRPDFDLRAFLDHWPGKDNFSEDYLLIEMSFRF